MRLAPILSLILILLLSVACQAGDGGNELIGRAVSTVEAGLSGSAPLALGELESALIGVYERVNPSVVFIVVESAGIELNSGSGFVYDEQGHIITNNHVVENGDAYEVVFSDGSRRRAELVGADPDSDLAVIRVDGLPDGAPPVTAQTENPLPAPQAWPAPEPSPQTPGPDYAPPVDTEAAVHAEAPRVHEHSSDAGPDQTVFVAGAGLTERVYAWGRSSDDAGGGPWDVKVSLIDPVYLTATLPERAYDSVFLVWFANEAGWSRPIRLNAPQPWWCWPREPVPGTPLRIFGRDLARRPDRTTSCVYLAQPGTEGRWLPIQRAGKYDVVAKLPADVPPDEYQL